MTTMHGRAGEYLDGALSAADEEAFLDHVTDCAACQAELHGEVQLRDREDSLRAAAAARVEVEPATVEAEPATVERAPANVVSIDRARARRRTLAIAGVVLAAAAAILFVVTRPRSTGRRPDVAVALAPQRSIETRIAGWAPAAAYRPYETMRSGTGAPREVIDPHAIAALSDAKDCAGVAATYVLSGELERASAQYEQCGPGADLDADRAGLAVLRGDPEAALELADRALAVAPAHPAALWNRALALRDLGLGLAAAAAFERVADVDPAWAAEAKRRADDTRAPLAAQRAHYQGVLAIGAAMAEGGPVLTADDARAVPSRARVILHDALRYTVDPDRREALRAVATALDGLVGDHLVRYVDLPRTRDPALIDGYRRAVIAGGAIDDATWTAWLARARTLHADDDLILGARVLTGRLGDGEPDGAAILAERTGDPWFTLAVEVRRAQALQAAGDEAGLAELLARVDCANGPGLRCVQLAIERTQFETASYQLPAARAHAHDAIALATQLGEWQLRLQALTFAGAAERLAGRYPQARAYYEERAGAWDACVSRNSALSIAETLYFEHRFADAVAAWRAAPACATPLAGNQLNVLARLARADAPAIDPAQLDAAIAAARGLPDAGAETDYLDYLQQWAALPAPAARAALDALGQRIAARDRAGIVGLGAAVASTLAVDAGERGAWDEAVTRTAAALGVEPPRACALAVAMDEYRLTAVAIDRAGVTTGYVERDRASYRPARWLAPAPLAAALRACDQVAVYALPPWIGIGPVFDAGVAWRYVMQPAPPPSPGPPRRVVIASPAIPRDLGLPALAPARVEGDAVLVSGAAATPARALDEAGTATLLEIRSHALWTSQSDAPVIALAPDDGGWALRADRIAARSLARAPIVVLASCAGGASAPYLHEAYGLPLAFRRAGARAVIAPLREIPDAEAEAFFNRLAEALGRGVAPAVAVAALRAEKIAADPTSWAASVVVFE